MKTFIISFTGYFIFSCISIAQRPITAEDSKITFKHGTIPGFMLTIPEVTYKAVEESWIKSLEKGTKSKVQNDAGELSIFGAIIKDIAEAPINVYSYIRNQDTVILLAASFELKKNEYISMEGRREESAKARDYLLLFAKDNYLNLAEEQLLSEEKILNKLENDLKSLEDDKTKLEKMIQSNTTTIVATNDELIILRTNLLSLNDELQAQTNQYNMLEEGPARDEKKKYIDDLEKRITNTSKDIESGEKKVADMQAEIEKAQNDSLPANIKEQEQTGKAIDQQKEVVRSFREKCNTIRGYR